MRLKDLRKLNSMTVDQMKAYRAFRSVHDLGMANGFLQLAHPTYTERWEFDPDNHYRLVSIH